MKKESTSFARQRLELLTMNEDFQSDVSAFRKKWKLPEGGLKSNQARKWWHWIAEESDKYMGRKDFLSEQKSLFNKLNLAERKIDRENTIKFKKKLKALDRKIPLNGFYRGIDDILNKYNLSDNYKDTMMTYLVNNCFSFLSRDNLRFWVEKDKKNEGKKIFLEIYSETTIKDVQRIWDWVKFHQKDAFGYKEGRKGKNRNLERDKRILELSKEGLSHPKISDKIEEEFGERIMYYDIAKKIQRLKKKIMGK